ncbi:hypothetical protein ICM_06231 [Bacillus cereus BAG1X2-3]|uniref:Uncharacterized protein n=1 Tax=Bacillus cereus TaxID=1396 RepID=A0A9X7E6I1_BACCE|nr:hypothetical protein [Bacillus cereus]EOO23008.1 hypothetical protein ICC_06378 [Bacillus cereus BAG1X1-1]EOO42788.1 hypothetical protein ICI_06295 [Bacillus cereus BAG1X2-1]EOO43899.1 hypothetical protein ICK_06592 [Bacillus cereus BAG1X2-2]EOO55930.1 hypothetical protein ICM_06231 [Bacillus cereus BAG1X2-3]EOO99870.1 hypothetical protein ICO_06642 [Bacillus cereus BAG2O-1]
MRKLFSGKRILERETNKGSSYFVVPEEKFQKYVVLWGYLIPYGVFNQPNKWVNTYTINPLDTYVLVTEFKPEEYEYMIYEETRVARQLHQILEPYGIDINNKVEEFVKLEEIPEAAISKVKDCLVEKKCMNEYPEDFPVVDGYEYIIEGKKRNLLLKLKLIMMMTHYMTKRRILIIVISLKLIVRQSQMDLFMYLKRMTIDGINIMQKALVKTVGS